VESSRRIPRRRMEDNSTPIRPASGSCRSCQPLLLLQLWHWISTVNSDRSVGLVGRSGSYGRIGSLVDEVSFKIKDTSNGSRVRIANHLDLVVSYILYYRSYYLSFTKSIDESIRTSSSIYWITMYPVGCRDLYVVIKISVLEEVSSLLEPVIY